MISKKRVSGTVSTTLYVLRSSTIHIPPGEEMPEFTLTPDGYEVEIPVEVRGYYVPYSPATRSDPEEGGYVEDVSATVGGKPFYLTDDEVEEAAIELEDLIISKAEAEEEDAYDVDEVDDE